jgi:hypothetical protein
MFKKLIDYKEGKIYAIRCYTDKTVLYIGCSKLPLKQRFGLHISNYKIGSTKNCLLHKAVKDDPLGWGNYYIELIEYYPCDNRKELCLREGFYQRNMKTTLNKNIAGRTSVEYTLEHKEKQKLNQQKFNIKNPGYSKKYYEKQKEKKDALIS